MYRLIISLLALILIIFALDKSGIQTIGHDFIQLKWYWIISLIAVALFNHTITVLRFYLLTHSYRKNHLSFLQILKVNFIGLFLAFWTPISIIGDGYRTLWINKNLCNNYKHAISLVILDRLIALSGICVFFLLLIPLYINYLDKNIIFTVVSGAAMFALGLIYLVSYKRNHRLLTKLVTLTKILKKTQINIKTFNLHFLTAFLYVFSFFGIMAIASYAINLKINILLLLGLTPLIFFIQNIPISFGGFGSRELTLLLLFGSTTDNASIISMSLIVGLATILASLPGGIFLILTPNFTSIFRRNSPKSINI